jgi:lipopolysaccharide biosynthesis glycosyltransferase
MNYKIIQCVYYLVFCPIIFVCSQSTNDVEKSNLYTFARGRSAKYFPSPSCCVGQNCLKTTSGKNAILTTIRSENYFPLLYSLACSIRQSNPGVELVVATVLGDLPNKYENAILALGNFVRLVYWDEYAFENTFHPRFSKNWVKLRAWNMTEYDSLLMVDADTVILRDITHLFKLPASFATVLDSDKDNSEYNSLGRMQGGVVFLRPCPAVCQHMMSILDSNPRLRFLNAHAEQSFLDWYFLDSRWALPVHYNAISKLSLVDHNNGTTHGGSKVTILHYANDKPFKIDVDKNPLHKFAICNSATHTQQVLDMLM